MLQRVQTENPDAATPKLAHTLSLTHSHTIGVTLPAVPNARALRQRHKRLAQPARRHETKVQTEKRPKFMIGAHVTSNVSSFRENKYINKGVFSFVCMHAKVPFHARAPSGHRVAQRHISRVRPGAALEARVGDRLGPASRRTRAHTHRQARWGRDEGV